MTLQLIQSPNGPVFVDDQDPLFEMMKLGVVPPKPAGTVGAPGGTPPIIEPPIPRRKPEGALNINESAAGRDLLKFANDPSSVLAGALGGGDGFGGALSAVKDFASGVVDRVIPESGRQTIAEAQSANAPALATAATPALQQAPPPVAKTSDGLTLPEFVGAIELSDVEAPAFDTENATSSAFGKFQIVRDTWEGLRKNGVVLDPFDIGKLDPQQQILAANALTEQNYAQLAKAFGRPPSSGELFSAHRWGAPGAIRLASAAPGELLKDIVGEFTPGEVDDVLKSNGFSQTSTARDAIAKSAADFADGILQATPTLSPSKTAAAPALLSGTPTGALSGAPDVASVGGGLSDVAALTAGVQQAVEDSGPLTARRRDAVFENLPNAPGRGRKAIRDFLLKPGVAEQLMALGGGILQGPTLGRGLGAGFTAAAEVSEKFNNPLANDGNFVSQLIKNEDGSLSRLLTNKKTGEQSVAPVGESDFFALNDPIISNKARGNQEQINRITTENSDLDAELARISISQSLLENSDLKLGLGAGTLTELQRILDFVSPGNDLKLQDVPAAEAFRALVISFTTDIIGKTKGSISDKEMELFLKASPALERSKAGNARILAALQFMAERRLERNFFIQQRLTANWNQSDAEVAWRVHLKNLDPPATQIRRILNLDEEGNPLPEVSDDQSSSGGITGDVLNDLLDFNSRNQ